MGRRRVRAGSVVVWREALNHLRQQAGALVVLAGFLLATVIGINLFPGTPDWQAGFLTGMLGTFFVAFTWWIAWVPSGLALRGMGPLAEEWTDDTLRKTPGVHAVVPSLKFAGRDVDHVVIAAAGVIAVETKWRSMAPDGDDILRAAEQAAAAGRTLRLSLRRKGLPDNLFRTAVIYWGPGAKELAAQTIDTALGAVTVVAGKRAETWLAGLRSGPVGIDYAGSLYSELNQLAIERDRAAITAGPMLRWLARTK